MNKKFIVKHSWEDHHQGGWDRGWIYRKWPSVGWQGTKDLVESYKFNKLELDYFKLSNSSKKDMLEGWSKTELIEV